MATSNDSSRDSKTTPESAKEDKEEIHVKTKLEFTENETYGYEFFPERLGRDDKKRWWFQPDKSILNPERSVCYVNVNNCVNNHPIVGLLIGALKQHGCPFSVRRHTSCEKCLSRVHGGYDPLTNQIVVCYNNSSRSNCCQVLGHELIHMFDYCRAKIDFKNPEHVACTEIRAANLNHCSFMSAFSAGTASPFNFKRRHRECVKNKAVLSVMSARDIPRRQAEEYVDKVFDKCYNDMEPIGRRPSSGKHEIYKAVAEAYLYGYTDDNDNKTEYRSKPVR